VCINVRVNNRSNHLSRKERATISTP
jgi:hypothetical protein